MRLKTSAVCVVLVALTGPFGWAQSRARPPKPIPQQALPGSPPAANSAPLSTTSPRVALEIVCGEEEWGRIVLELNAAQAPQTVENFLQLVETGYYDGTIFHRILPNFLIQGGGYGADGQPKRPATRRPLRNEANNGLKNVRGAVAMARGRNPHSATTQFFINVVDNPKLDHPGHDGWGYCVFGRVVEGLPIVERIRRLATRAGPAGGDSTPSWPVNPPLIRRAYRLGETAGGGSTSAPAAPATELESAPQVEPDEEITPVPGQEPAPEEVQPPTTQPAELGPDGAALVGES